MRHYGQQSAITLIFGPEGRVLVLRRSRTDPWKPGHWNFPGGKVDPTDPSVIHGALREVQEETGISLDRSQLNWAFSFRTPGLVNVFWVLLSHRPRVRFPDGEHDAYAWVFPQQIPQPSIHSVRHIVEQITGTMWNLAPVDPAPVPKNWRACRATLSVHGDVVADRALEGLPESLKFAEAVADTVRVCAGTVSRHIW